MRSSRRQARHAPAHVRREEDAQRPGVTATGEAFANRPPAHAAGGGGGDFGGFGVLGGDGTLGGDGALGGYGAAGGHGAATAHRSGATVPRAAPTGPPVGVVVDAGRGERLGGPQADQHVQLVADQPDPTPMRSGRAVLRGVAKRDRTLVVGGAQLRLLVLASTDEDTVAVDLASGAVLRLRIPWPEGHEPDLSPFDVVEATLADDPERDDLAQPEAATAASLPRHVGSLRGRRTRRLLNRLVVTPDGPLLGFPGPSAPYWEFRGFRPSVALIRPARGPQLIRRPGDGSTWVRFGLQRDDIWLPVEDTRTCRALDASRRERLHGKALGTALGFTPHYLLVAVSSPREGHCYKICAGVLPKD